MKVHVYHRTTTIGEDIDSQIKSIWNQALEQGYSIEQTYRDDGISGATLDRPGLNQLLEDARNGKIKAVLANDITCIASVPNDFSKIKLELTALGIELHFIHPPSPKCQLYC
jgi:site-specific DNA recombinase